MIIAGSPRPPDSDSQVQRLKWAIGAIPHDHQDLAFLASLLAHAIERPGLTERQEKWARRIVDALIRDWHAEHFVHAGVCDLRTVSPAGEA